MTNSSPVVSESPETSDSTPASNSHKFRCHENRHMSLRDYAVWSLCRRLAHTTGLLNYSGETIAELFRETCRRTVSRAIQSLKKDGWLVLVQAASKKGQTPNIYKVLDHPGWAQKHPDRCKRGVSPEHHVTNAGAGNVGHLSTYVGTPEHIGWDLSHHTHGTPEHHKVEEQPDTKKKTKQKPPLPFLPPSSPLPPAVGQPEPPSASEEVGTPEHIPPSTNKCLVEGQTSTETVPDTPSGELLEKLSELAAVVTERVLFKQSVESLDADALRFANNFALPELKKLFLWALDDPFWLERISGRNALRSFLRHVPTIRQQYRADQKRQQKKVATLKAASVAPDPTREFLMEVV